MIGNEYEIGSPEHARSLAATLSKSEEITLGPSDQEICAKALLAYAPPIDATKAA